MAFPRVFSLLKQTGLLNVCVIEVVASDPQDFTTYGRADNWPGMVKTEILTVPLPTFFCPVAKIPPGAYILELYQMKGHGHPKRLLIKLA